MGTQAALGSNNKQKRAGKLGRVILVSLLVLVIGVGAAWYFLGKNTQAQAVAQAGSATKDVTVERGSIQITASGSGTLVSNQAVNLSFSTSGRVSELNVNLGDRVKAGDVLARLEKAQDLEANLVSAQASLLQAQQELADLQKKGGSSLAKAYQDLVNAQNAYDDALSDSQRTELARCTPELFNKYKTALEQATEKLNALYLIDPYSEEVVIAGYDHDTAVANYSYCSAYTATEKLSAESTLEVAKVALQEAENTYETLKESAGIDPDMLSRLETWVEAAQTQADSAQEAVEGTTLIAPIDGKVTTLAGSIGAIVDTSTFITISDVNHPTVTVSLDETDMGQLVVGNPAVVTFTALAGQSFSGKVSLANPQMIAFGPFRAASGQVTLDEEYASTFESLQLGLSATVTITGKGAANVLLVPVDALKQLSSGDYVVSLVGSDGQVTQQIVSVGLQNDSYAEITAGLSEGDVVRVKVKVYEDSGFPGGGMFMDGGGGRMP